jgi:hypothetical protein
MGFAFALGLGDRRRRSLAMAKIDGDPYPLAARSRALEHN